MQMVPPPRPLPIVLLCWLLLIGTTMTARVKTVDGSKPALQDPTTNSSLPGCDISQAEFAGGHAENIIFDKERAEFKKSHAIKDWDRFENELRFLQEANADPLFRNLVPDLKRVEEINCRQFMVMNDVVREAKLKVPVIADFKLGQQSWKPDFHGEGGADEKKRAKMEILDSSTTTKTLGVRATSIQLPPSLDTWVKGSVPEEGPFQAAGRAAVKKDSIPEGQDWLAASDPSSFARVMREYLPTPQLRRKFVEKLQPFIETFKVQKTYRFTGASLLVFYDGAGAGGSDPNLGMVMIDFPHTIGSPADAAGEIDKGVLTGLSSLETIATHLGMSPNRNSIGGA